MKCFTYLFIFSTSLIINVCAHQHQTTFEKNMFYSFYTIQPDTTITPEMLQNMRSNPNKTLLIAGNRAISLEERENIILFHLMDRNAQEPSCPRTQLAIPTPKEIPPYIQEMLTKKEQRCIKYHLPKDSNSFYEEHIDIIPKRAYDASTPEQLTLLSAALKQRLFFHT